MRAACPWLETVSPPMPTHWTLETRQFHDMDHGRVYRVRIALPRQPAPATGWPSLCLLDGDWALPPLLQQADTLPPVALIAIGYGGDSSQHQAARAYDYTPPPPPGESNADPRNPQWLNGGADYFLSFLDERLLPCLQRDLGLDPSRRSLYGHSYGGLFALHAFLSRPAVFDGYAIASPSLWWHDGWVLRQAERLGRRAPDTPRHLLLMAGELEQWHPQPVGPDGTPSSRSEGRSTVPALRQLYSRLSRQAWLQHTLDIFPGIGHGDTLAASARRATEFAAGLPGRAPAPASRPDLP